MIRLLTYTTLYPNSVRPDHGVFVETRLKHLLDDGRVSARVVAPVPWFPFSHSRFGDYGDFARVPAMETRNGIDVSHPRYPVIPKLGTNLAPRLLAAATRAKIATTLSDGPRPDLIDAHYLYPDGVAAVELGRRFGLPVVLTARGNDVNLLPDSAGPRRRILTACRHAAAVVAVSPALKDRLVEIGVAPDKVTVLRNGVDLERFRPATDRAALRARLGWQGDGPWLLSAGHLIPRKGHDLAIAALAEVPDAGLAIVGDGPEMASLHRLAGRLQVADRVRFLGRLAPTEMPDRFAAADALVLASSSEGWANVLLEAMATGTPVVATESSGAAHMVQDPATGRVVAERSAAALAAALRDILAAPPDRAAVRARAEQFGWGETVDGLVALFQKVLAGR